LYFCNIVSSSRLYQLIALYYSIEQNIKYFELYVLCMDDETYGILNSIKFEHIHMFSLSQLEDDTLKGIKSDRSINEYCWTLKPTFILHILKQYAFIDRLTYLDADMFFYNNPIHIFEKGNTASVLISKHDFFTELLYMEKDVGRFNSGFISFKNTRSGISCLVWWKEKCIGWCYDTTVTGQFGDQKYLEQMYELFNDVSIIEVPGVNIGPWNDADKKIYRLRGKLHIDDHPLVLYHYCGFRIYDKNSCAFTFGNLCNPVIHSPYMQAVRKAIMQVQAVAPDFDGCFPEKNTLEKYNIYNLI